MNRQDEEIAALKASVNCAAMLERLPPVWQLDVKQSTRRSLKYRRGPGEIVIVTHDGRGWWDPFSEAKGDVFALAQHLDPGLDFVAARRLLHRFAGIVPSHPPSIRARGSPTDPLPVIRRWERRSLVSPGSPAWLYLAGSRSLPEPILTIAVAVDAVRAGPHGSAWFAHRDATGVVTGIEMRGPDWRNFSAGGSKTLFRLPGGPGPLPRVAVCEGAIDAISLAAIEGLRGDTLYAATTGGMGPATIAAIQQLLHAMSADPASILIAATDADMAGRRYAGRLAELATEAGVQFEAILPPDGLNDWNDALRTMAPAT